MLSFIIYRSDIPREAFKIVRTYKNRGLGLFLYQGIWDLILSLALLYDGQS